MRTSGAARTGLVLTSLVACLFVLASCGGDGDKGNGTATESTTTPTETTTTREDKDAAGEGKQLFADNCGSCHTLAAADTTGSVGPNLDELDLSKSKVADQVENGSGGMPAFKGQLSEQEIDTVSSFVVESGK